jgi:hypothetical protein
MSLEPLLVASSLNYSHPYNKSISWLSRNVKDFDYIVGEKSID